MANVLRIAATECCTNKDFTLLVSDEFSEITIGSTIQIDLKIKPKNPKCYYVNYFEPVGETAEYDLLGVFNGCEECLSGISSTVQVSTCVGKDGLPETYFIDINSFTTLPTIGGIYYLVFQIETEKGPLIIKGCFNIDCYSGDTDKLYSLTSISDSYTGCTECFLNNLQVWEVTSCLGGANYYVSLPIGFDYTNYIISFVDSFGENLCGTVKLLGSYEPTATLTSILGLSISVEGGTVSCEDCLVISTEKRIITNCLDGTEQVVWGSTFYEGTEITNLSSIYGCFEVGNLTESAVTVTEFLNFDPQPDCQECLQCNGLYYSYSSCTNTGPIDSLYLPEGQGAGLPDGTYGPFETTTDGSGVGATVFVEVTAGIITNVTISNIGIGYSIGNYIFVSEFDINASGPAFIEITNILTTGIVSSYQYVSNPIGKTFYIPQLNDCVEITSVTNPSDAGPNYVLWSFEVFENCTQCQTNANNYYIWKTDECGSGSNYIVILNSNSFTIGDYVKVLRGTMDFQCHRLVSPYTYSDGNLSAYISNTTIPFDNCTTCNSGTLIGASIAKCGGGGQQFVNIPINTWNQMAYLDSQSIFVLEQYGQCYGLLNTCPLEPNYTTIYPYQTYYNCIECDLDNTRFPRSANTESFMCLQICTESGSTVVSVSGPHPEWTDAYGTQVTQLDMFTLGGPNGLNN